MVDRRIRNLTILLLTLHTASTVNSCFRTNPSEVLTVATTSKTCSTYVCPSGWKYYANSIGMHSCFVLLKGPTGTCGSPYGCGTFPNGCQTAIQSCNALGGNLASIHDANENTFVGNIANAVFAGGQLPQTCIGLMSTNPAGTTDSAQFVWTDGSPYNYMYWLSGDPNNLIPPETCVIMQTIFDAPTLNTWDDRECTTPMINAVCEVPAQCV